MTIRFAAARPDGARPLGVSDGTAPVGSANDNVQGFSDDRMLRAALRHFATHGLGAADAARANAEQAFFAGDRDEYAWWLGICRMLDRRMADAVAARQEAAKRG
jgi:hypothetical protein